MSPETLFSVHLVLGYVVWLLCFGVYIWPRLKAMDRINYPVSLRWRGALGWTRDGLVEFAGRADVQAEMFLGHTIGRAAITTAAQALGSPEPAHQDERDTPPREPLPSRGVAFFAR